jgi:hypothetical protein
VGHGIPDSSHGWIDEADNKLREFAFRAALVCDPAEDCYNERVLSRAVGL